MISKENYELVKKAIKIHNNLKDRTYLILYKVNAKQKSKVMETSILEENFWHLVGCKIDDSLKLTSEQKHQLYLDCLVEQLIVKKILFQNETKASYQYIESTCKKYILKCTSCGKIVNTDCSDLENVCRHLQENHNFLIDEANITLYGECQDCQKKEDNHHEED